MLPTFYIGGLDPCQTVRDFVLTRTLLQYEKDRSLSAEDTEIAIYNLAGAVSFGKRLSTARQNVTLSSGTS